VTRDVASVSTTCRSRCRATSAARRAASHEAKATFASTPANSSPTTGRTSWRRSDERCGSGGIDRRLVDGRSETPRRRVFRDLTAGKDGRIPGWAPARLRGPGSAWRHGRGVVLAAVAASGSPASRRRTFAEGLPALRSLRAACAFALRAALTGEAGSRNTGDPSPASVAGSPFLPLHRRGGDRRTLEE
jgi:hypothetical protein